MCRTRCYVVVEEEDNASRDHLVAMTSWFFCIALPIHGTVRDLRRYTIQAKDKSAAR